MVSSAYIHIPFCKSKCKYCSFISGTNLEAVNDYINALSKEIRILYRGEELNTLYFGGGTPSVLDINHVKKLYDSFNLTKDCEVTFEVNPDDGSLEYFKKLFDIGINRISMGAQTFDDGVLKYIGRRHSADNIKSAVNNAKHAGFSNISLDLIYGLSEKDIFKDIDEILKLDVRHISTYGLKIEKGSYFYNHNIKNFPDDDKQADMYLKINEILEKNNYERYEVSNFAIRGFESRHNLNYWNNQDYYGFGLAAHGYQNGIRYSNLKNIKSYIENPVVKDFENVLTEREKLEEEIFLGFRKSEGINVSKINNKYGIDFDKKYSEILCKYRDYIIKTTNGYTLNIAGVLLSNIILAEFIDL